MLISLNRRVPCRPTLLAYLDCHQTQIVAIQETKNDSSISTSELFPETCPYNIYRKDRNSKGGGFHFFP